MTATYQTVVTLHVLAALCWLGGMFFLALVGAPVLRALEPPELRQRLFTALGMRARTVGWWAVATLIVTGVALLELRGLLRWEGVLAAPSFWRTGTGQALAWKLASVATMLGASLVHDFVLGPRAARMAAEAPGAPRLRRRVALLARGSAVAGIVIVIAAVRLARGG